MIGTRLNKPIKRTEYINLTTWCDSNNATIEDKGDYYEVVALPEPEPVAEKTAMERYPDLVVELIRERYTINDELAMLRQRDSKPDEWLQYNDYCESCKIRARQALGL